MALNLCSQKGIFSHKKSCCYIQIILVFRIICVIKCWSTLKLHITDLSFSRTHAVRLCWRHVSIKKRAGVYIQLQLWWSVVTPCFQERASGLKTRIYFWNSTLNFTATLTVKLNPTPTHGVQNNKNKSLLWSPFSPPRNGCPKSPVSVEMLEKPL